MHLAIHSSFQPYTHAEGSLAFYREVLGAGVTLPTAGPDATFDALHAACAEVVKEPTAQD